MVAWDLDRLYRQPRELEDLIDLADQKHLALATVGGDADLCTDNGRLFARIKGAVARSEVERKSARQKRANKQRAEAGRPSRSTVPFGYRKGDDGALVLEPAEAMMVRDAYSAILAGRQPARHRQGVERRRRADQARQDVVRCHGAAAAAVLAQRGTGGVPG